MENVISYRLQIIAIVTALIFMFFIFRLIAKGKLREEYSFIWIVCTALLLLFAVWRDGLDVIAKLLGIYYAPSLIFLGAIFAIVVFLVHLSVVNSKQHKQIKDLAQEMALLKEKLEAKQKEKQ
ncbi:MAG: DUF2304 domain-containing protein [Bacteroidetes bacterium]|jgi:hypothetical protein|nr:DUF2304 domain-containing protein [Bacteroidota bacterium]